MGESEKYIPTQQDWQEVMQQGYNDWPKHTKDHWLDTIQSGELCRDPDCEIHYEPDPVSPDENFDMLEEQMRVYMSGFKDPADPDVEVSEVERYKCNGASNTLRVIFNTGLHIDIGLGSRDIHLKRGDRTSPLLGVEVWDWTLRTSQNTFGNDAQHELHLVAQPSLSRSTIEVERMSKPKFIPLRNVAMYEEVHTHRVECFTEEYTALVIKQARLTWSKMKNSPLLTVFGITPEFMKRPAPFTPPERDGD